MNRKNRAYFLGLIIFLFISIFSILLFADSKKSVAECPYIKSKENVSCPYIQENLDKQRLVCPYMDNKMKSKTENDVRNSDSCPYLKNKKEVRTRYNTIKLISS